VPEVTAAPSLTAALADLPAGQRLVLDPASDAALALALDTGGGADDDDVTIVSGPEGGLTAGERDQLAGFAPLGLGPRVLRADTAPVVAVALIRAATRS
jgi:16S rRNA (uracil1498-N3)-methyltransferase